MALSARETGRLTVESEVVKTNLEQEVETGTDLLEYLKGYLLLLMVEVRLHLIEPLTEFGNVH